MAVSAIQDVRNAKLGKAERGGAYRAGLARLA
jgi:hypothetical protein